MFIGQFVSPAAMPKTELSSHGFSWQMVSHDSGQPPAVLLTALVTDTTMGSLSSPAPLPLPIEHLQGGRNFI